MPQPGKTYSAKPSEITASWYIIDASGQTLGRLAANVAKLLRGKHKPMYTPHLNTGDHVIVVNVKGIRVTGKKLTDKVYTSYSGYPGGLHKRAYGDMVDKHPTFPFRHAVGGMLQHGTLGKAQLRRLKVYAGDAHPHRAQQPVPIRFGEKGEIQVIGR
jgi:large subunit ribosomal protein L13